MVWHYEWYVCAYVCLFWNITHTNEKTKNKNVLGIASTIGFALGYVYSIQATFVIASIVVAFTCIVTCLAVKEQPLGLIEARESIVNRETNCQTIYRRLAEIFLAFRDMPRPILVSFVFFFVYGLSFLLPFRVGWVQFCLIHTILKTFE